MINEKRFKLIFGGGYIIDDLTGEKYPIRNDYNYAQDLCNLLNQINERADKNAELFLDSNFRNHYQLWRR